MSPRILEIDGASLTIGQVVALARTSPSEVQVRLAESAIRRTCEVRDYLEENWLADDSAVAYGINTGVGRMKDARVPSIDLDRYQSLLVNAHAAGVGPPITSEQVRALLLLRANALAKGVSGLRVEVLERLLELINSGVEPVIPVQGSVGASGDLAPCAHMVATMCGHESAEAIYRGERMPAQRALAEAGLEPKFQLKAKDVVALINGSTLSLALAVLGVHDAEVLAETADIATALSIEAMRGELTAFDERIHTLRNSPEQVVVARNIRRLLEGSARVTEEARIEQLPDEFRPLGRYQPRVQDAYSMRCAPQVHGAARALIVAARRLVEQEVNAATDNPLILSNEQGGYEVLSGGNFHGEPIAFAADILSIAIAELGSISERRCFRMTDPAMSYGLPSNLVGGRPGLNSGFGMVHGTAAALASENKVMCFPASVDSIPTKANQEDHVSMSTYASVKLLKIIANTQTILGIELLCAAQGVDLGARSLRNHTLGRGTAFVHEAVRNIVPPTEDDVYQASQIGLMTELVRTGILNEGMSRTVGPLA